MQDVAEIGRPEMTFRQAIETAGSEPILTLLDVEQVRAFVSLDPAAEWESELRVLIPKEVLKTVRREFVTAARLADHAENGAVSYRATAPDTRLQSALVSETGYSTFLWTGDGGLIKAGGSDDAATDSLRDRMEDQWEAGEAFPLRTPGYSTLLSSLEEDFGTEVRSDVETVLEDEATSPGLGDAVDQNDMIVLLGARNRLQLYRLSKWAERIEFASAATFSRVKGRLEDAGVVGAEKVPQDIGRPRQELVLDPDLRDTDPVKLLTTVDSILS
jgi:hypothetical protein